MTYKMSELEEAAVEVNMIFGGFGTAPTDPQLETGLRTVAAMMLLQAQRVERALDRQTEMLERIANSLESFDEAFFRQPIEVKARVSGSVETTEVGA